MATARPLVQVFDAQSGKSSSKVALPAVFGAPIRRDIVHFVHSNIAKNSRQAYAVAENAGHQHSAISWGTGRAVSRIPRISGSGTHRSGQGAFGNMCRKGRMFAPTKIWRRWHRKVNVNQRRYAVVSAVAATALVPLVQARGHRVDKVDEIPLVLDNLAGVSKTKAASAILSRFGALDDVIKAKESRAVRLGAGKTRNRRYVMRRGPLLVVADIDGPEVKRAFRNLPGLEISNVGSLNLLQLAPGGHLGRFVIWSKAAFEQLPAIYGSVDTAAAAKKGYTLPRPVVTNADIATVINAPTVQARVRPVVRAAEAIVRANPLRNRALLDKLNPYAAEVRKGAANHTGLKKISTRKDKAARAASRAFYRHLTSSE
jgi:large subunit ribosomal protein L4e